MLDFMKWELVGPILLGVAVVPIVRWIAGWISGKGVELVQEELKKLQTKLNENGVLGQIQADDALIAICEHALPEVVHDLTEDIQKALADGKIDKVEWAAIGRKVWDKVKDQVRGGTNDYLKNSSFTDGEALAAMVAKRFFSLQLAQKKGLVTEAPREATK